MQGTFTILTETKAAFELNKHEGTITYGYDVNGHACAAESLIAQYFRVSERNS